MKGAFRLAIFMFVLQMAMWIFRSHLVLTGALFLTTSVAISTSLYFAVLVALLYMALEPYVRRHWPQSIISWSRVLLGRWRDPLVGRDVLIGLVLGCGWVLIFLAYVAYLVHLNYVSQTGNYEFMTGVRQAIGCWLQRIATDGIQGTLIFFFVIFLFRLLLRNQWLAAGAFVLLLATMQSLKNEHFWMCFLAFSLVYSLAAVALVRFGLVSLSAALITTDLILGAPVTANFSHWFVGSTIFVFASIATVGAWAFYTALSGQKLWKDELFD